MGDENCPKCGLKLSYDRYRSENECGEETLGDWYSTHSAEECCDELLVQLVAKDARIVELELLLGDDRTVVVAACEMLNVARARVAELERGAVKIVGLTPAPRLRF